MSASYELERFWIRAGETPQLWGGFLPDPTTPPGRRINPSIHSTGELSRYACVALLGEPGSGKSRGLQALQALETPSVGLSLNVDLRSFLSDSSLRSAVFEAPQFSAWRSTKTPLTVYLDSLDECLIHVRTVAALLVDGLRPTMAANEAPLRLRIACRSAEWPALLAQELPRLWTGEEDFGAFEIAPLRASDVELAAAACGVEPAAFLAEVRKQDAEAFALRPLTLKFLLSSFASAKGLQHSVAALYEAGCLELAREQNPSRMSSAKPRLDPGARLRIAERLAAFSLLCRRPTIYVGEVESEASSQDLRLSQVCMDSSGPSGPEVHRADVEEVLRTALFTNAGPDRTGWMHWTLPEYLAARYLTSRLDTTRQLELLTFPDSAGAPRVVPQLREVAAWAATHNPELADAIVQIDSSLILRTKGLELSPEARRRVVDAIFRQLSDGSLDYVRLDLRRTASVLSHAGLGEQLGAFLHNPQSTLEVRLAAVDIAGEGCAVQLAPALLATALSKDAPILLRRAAIPAWVKLAPRDELRSLIPLLSLPEAEDPEDDLKGEALVALWPAALSAEELFGALTLPHKHHYYGRYTHFLHETFSQLPSENLPLALRWLASNEDQQDLLPLGERLEQRALENAPVPGVLEALAQLLVTRHARRAELLGSGSLKQNEGTPELDTDTRRRLLVCIAHAQDEAAHSQAEDEAVDISVFELREVGLLVSSDLAWLLGRAESAQSGHDASRWAAWAEGMADWTSPEQLDLVLEAWESCEAVRDAFRYLAPVELDSDSARRQREAWQRSYRTKPQPKVAHPPAPEMTRRWLERFEAGDSLAWWRLNRDLTLRPNSDRYGDESKMDITALPGWAELDESLRQRCVDAAGTYLNNADPKTADWLGTRTIYWPAVAGYRALLLLRRLRPKALARLPSDSWSRWAAAVVAYGPLDHGTQADQGLLLEQAVRNAPGEVAKAILAEVDRDNREHQSAAAIYRLAEAWPTALVEGLLGRLARRQLAPEVAGVVLERLLAQGKLRAQSVAVAYVADMRHQRELALAAAGALLTHPQQRTWPALWRALSTDRTWGSEVVLHLHGFPDREVASRLVSSVSADLVCQFLLFLFQEFPPEKDAEHDGAHYVDAREGAAHLRDAIFRRLVEKGTDGSAQAVRGLVQHLPYLKTSSYWRNAAEHARLQAQWRGVEPEAMARLLARTESHVVESAEQLLEVVLESLQRLEMRLKGETPAVRDLWNTDRTPKSEEHLSDYVKRHLQAELTGKNVVVNREVQIRSDQRTDVHVDAVLPGTNERVSVIIEAKGCWNAGLMEDMAGQLVLRYLKDNPGCAGIFLVGWFLCEEWNPNDSRKRKTRKWSLEEARGALAKQAQAQCTPATPVHAVVLDTRWR